MAAGDVDLERLVSVLPSRAADAVSALFHPLAVVIGLLAYVAFTHTDGPAAALGWFALTAGLTAGVPWLMLRLLHRLGVVDDLQVVRRSQRPLLFAMTTVPLTFAVVLLGRFDPPLHLYAVQVGLLCGLLAIGIVSLVWKASAHVAVLGGAVAILAVELPVVAVLVAAIIPLVAWARVRAGRHTVAQVLGGLVIGVVTSWWVFTTLA